MKKWLLVSLFLMFGVASLFAGGNDGIVYATPVAVVPGDTNAGITLTVKDFQQAWGTSGVIIFAIPTQLPVPQLTPGVAGAISVTVKGTGTETNFPAINGRAVSVTVSNMNASALVLNYAIVAIPTAITGSLTWKFWDYTDSSSNTYLANTAMTPLVMPIRTATTAPTSTPTPTFTPTATPTQIIVNGTIISTKEESANRYGMERIITIKQNISTAAPKYIHILTGAKEFEGWIGTRNGGAVSIDWTEGGAVGGVGTTLTVYNTNRLAGMPTPGIKAYEDGNTLAGGTALDTKYINGGNEIKSIRYVFKASTTYWFKITPDVIGTTCNVWLQGWEQ
jgi:hypothetical protein